MRVFVTGATGFAGSHLVDRLLADGHEVYALVHQGSSHQPLPASEAIHAIAGDLLDLPSLEAAVSATQPEVIFHLAGQANPGLSWKDPALTVAVNTGGTANLLEAAVRFGRPRVVVVTSAEIYGRIEPQMLPLTEETVTEPRHPYGVSKTAAGMLVEVYWQRYRLPVVEARPFNHIGPRQMLGFVVPDFASQLAAIKLGQTPAEMAVGNLEAQRDFSDVRDVVAAYWQLALDGRPGEAYLICSGKPVAVRTILDCLIELCGIEVEIVADPKRMRPSDTPCLYGSFAKIEHDTGWQPQISLRQSLSDAFAEWSSKLART